jgi:phage-related protein
MAVDVFTWVPLLVSPGGQTTLRTLKAQYGDGYSQEVTDGINNEVSSWQLQFNGNAAKITAIRDFLRARKGGTSFYWTPPLDGQLLFRCNTYTPPQPLGAGAYSLSATFQQVFAP